MNIYPKWWQNHESPTLNKWQGYTIHLKFYLKIIIIILLLKFSVVNIFDVCCYDLGLVISPHSCHLIAPMGATLRTVFSFSNTGEERDLLDRSTRISAADGDVAPKLSFHPDSNKEGKLLSLRAWP